MTGAFTPLALDGVRIIDLTDRSCVYATKILCDLGAEMIRVEPPDGDPMRTVPPLDDKTGASLFHAFMNVNKRSVTLDLEGEDGRTLFGRLVATADIVVESARPGALDTAGIGYAAFAEACPALVWTSITPFGADGPRAGWTADDLVIQAIGGLMNLTGSPDREPLRLYGEQTCYIAGLHAASATLMATWHALMTGEGQLVDVSIQECVAHTLENAIQFYTAEGIVRQRQRGRRDPGAGVFPCRDGEVFLMAGLSMISSSWHNLVALLREAGVEGADALAEPRWSDQAFRRTEGAQRIAAEVITRFTETRGKNELYDLTQQHRILSAPMNRIGDLFDNAQLKFLDWFLEQSWDDRVAVWPGPPVRLSETPRRAPLRVAAPGADNEAVLGALAVSERARESVA